MKRLGSKKLEQLGSAIFAEVDEWKKEASARGLQVIDLGIGSPDLPPSPAVVEALRAATADMANYSYPSSEGLAEFREKAAEWLAWRFGASVDPQHELLALMGTQDGLAHLPLALCDPGDTAIVPDPGYPIYAAGLALAGGVPYVTPLTRDNDFLPQFDRIPREVADKAVYMLISYPSNPLAAVASPDFYEQAVAFGRKHDILIVNDLAYSEMAFDGHRPSSILTVPGARQTAIEFHSLSKSFNMAGGRIGFVAGRRDAVEALKRLKSNIDYGPFKAVQRAGIAAMDEHMRGGTASVSAVYERRRDLFVSELERAGWTIGRPAATMFVWAAIPPGTSSRQISREMVLETGVAVIPGDAFGAQGEGYIRIALVQSDELLIEAARRIGSFMNKWRRMGDVR